MKINITDIDSEKTYIEINEDFELDSEVIKSTDIQKISPIKVQGIISMVDENMFKIDVTIKGVMILLCAISLDEVEYPFSIKINEIVENLNNLSNTLDIFPIIWENIVLEIPSRIVKENYKTKTSGAGWNLVTEEDVNNNQLNELKSLLDMEEEE